MIRASMAMVTLRAQEEPSRQRRHHATEARTPCIFRLNLTHVSFLTSYQSSDAREVAKRWYGCVPSPGVVGEALDEIKLMGLGDRESGISRRSPSLT